MQRVETQQGKTEHAQHTHNTEHTGHTGHTEQRRGWGRIGGHWRARVWWMFVFISGFACGSVYQSRAAWATDVDATYQKLRIFSQVLSYIQEQYVDEIAPEDLVYQAVTGMMSMLDPHSVFMRPAEYEKLRQDTTGEFGGLGLELTQEGVGLFIETVFPRQPADNAGLKAGDEILRIDDTEASSLSVDKAAAMLRGLPGTRVTVQIRRSAWPAPRDVLLIRKQLQIPSVDFHLVDAASIYKNTDTRGIGNSNSIDGKRPQKVGYARIRSFQDRTDQELGQALAQMQKEAGQLDGLLLDLRDNPGGLLDEGVKVADRFLQSGVIVTTAGRNGRNSERNEARRDGTEPTYPVVLLVNGGSASASEIVAGAMQDYARAPIVGTRTYGKGSVQTLFGLDDGAGLKLTVARYFTPKGRSIHGKGIVPDVPVPHDLLGDEDAFLRFALDAFRPAASAVVPAAKGNGATAPKNR